MLKAVIFDFDDTLVKTRQSKWDALIETGRRYYKLDITKEHVSKYWGLPFESMLTGVLMNAAPFDELCANYFTVTTEYPMEPHDGAIEATRKLAEKFEVGVLSASNKKLVIWDLKIIGFPVEKFIYVQTAEDTNVHKPNPLVFGPMLKIAADKGIHSQEILYVGDAMKDYQAASGAGLVFLGIAHTQADADIFKIQNIPFIENFSQLTDKLI